MNAQQRSSSGSDGHNLRPEDLAAVARLPLFCDLGSTVLAEITAEASVNKYARNDIIFRQGDAPSALRVVLDGQVPENLSNAILKGTFTGTVVSEDNKSPLPV